MQPVIFIIGKFKIVAAASGFTSNGSAIGINFFYNFHSWLKSLQVVRTCNGEDWSEQLQLRKRI